MHLHRQWCGAEGTVVCGMRGDHELSLLNMERVQEARVRLLYTKRTLVVLLDIRVI